MLVQTLKRIALLLLLAMPLCAQTKVDWATQVKNKSWVDAKDYGVKGGATYGCFGIFSNVSHTVNTGAADQIVTAADIGDIFVASNNACYGNNGAHTGGAIVGASCPPTCPTITGVTTAHQFTISDLPSASAGDGTTCCTWAKGKVNDGPALQIAYNALIANCSATLLLPGTEMLVGNPIYVTAGQCVGRSSIEGNGSMLLVLPGFDATTVGVTTGMLFGNSLGYSMDYRNFIVNGLGQYTVTGAVNKSALIIGFTATAENVVFTQWGTATAGMLGFYCSVAADSIANLHNVGTYNGPPMNIGPYCYADHVYHLTRVGLTINAVGNQDVYTNDSQFYNYGGATNSAATFGGTGSWISTGDSFFGKPGQNGISFTSGVLGPIYLNQDNIVAANVGIYPNNATAVIHLHQTRVSGVTNAIGFATAGSKVFDDCGNMMGANGSWTNITLFGSCSVTGTALVAGNVGLTSGWDTSTVTAVGAGGESHKGTFTITAAGTPGLNPRITLTFPTPFWVAPTYCMLQQIGGMLGVLTVPLNSAGTPTLAAVTFDLAGTPVATQTYTFGYRCS